VEEYEGDDGDRRGKKYARVETEGNWAEVETSCGSEYIPEESGSRRNASNSESLDTEPEFSNASDGIEVGEGSCTERKRRSSMIFKLEVLGDHLRKKILWTRQAMIMRREITVGVKIVLMCRW